MTTMSETRSPGPSPVPSIVAALRDAGIEYQGLTLAYRDLPDAFDPTSKVITIRLNLVDAIKLRDLLNAATEKGNQP